MVMAYIFYRDDNDTGALFYLGEQEVWWLFSLRVEPRHKHE